MQKRKRRARVFLFLEALDYLGDVTGKETLGQKGAIIGHEKPPVFAIVLYNGETRWTGATTLVDLIDCPSGLKDYQPQF